MSPEDWARVEALFHQALDVAEPERHAFLERVCPQGDPLRAELDSLLESDASAAEILVAPPSRLAADLLKQQPGGLSPGAKIRDYEIQSLISVGGMGEVYLARDLRSGARCVLKILRLHLTASLQAVERFETEALAASALRHPNIVAIHEFGESPAGRFIAMEWVDGITWRDLMKTGPHGPARLSEWGGQAARALQAAHGAGVLHRDIKPENMMLQKDGVVKILDFGLARVTGRDRPEPAAIGASGTISGTLSGTLLYMSPEIFRGETATSASDIYSLGAVLYELAAGEHPFAGDTPLDVYEAIEFREIAPPRHVPDAIAALILRMLERDPARRPPASEVWRELSKF